MSEYIESESIDVSESSVAAGPSLAEILGQIGSLASSGAQLAASGIKHGIQAAREFHAEAQAAQNISFQQAHSLVASNSTAFGALQQVAQADPGLSIAGEEVEHLKARLQTLTASNDLQGVQSLTHGLITTRQSLTHSSVIQKASESCQAIGFSPEIIPASGGIITAHDPHSRKKISLSVEKDRQGGVRLHCDLDGFNGSGCTETYEQLKAELAKRGVSFREKVRQRKDRRGAYDRNRLPQRGRNQVHNRH